MSDYTTSFGISRTPNDNEEAARMISLPPVDGEVPIIYPAENDSPLSDKTGVDKQDVAHVQQQEADLLAGIPEGEE
jgi:hypothetical protein